MTAKHSLHGGKSPFLLYPPSNAGLGDTGNDCRVRFCVGAPRTTARDALFLQIEGNVCRGNLNESLSDVRNTNRPTDFGMKGFIDSLPKFWTRSQELLPLDVTTGGCESIATIACHAILKSRACL